MRNSGIGTFLFIGFIASGISTLAISPASANAITYNILGQGAGIPLTGFITTDGHLGTLSLSDIVAWQITETAPAARVL